MGDIEKIGIAAMDIFEVDPSKDIRDMTTRLAAYTMLKFMYLKGF